MTLIRILVLLLLLIIGFYAPSFCQYSRLPRWEAGVIGGPIGFLGDLGGNNQLGGGFLKDYNRQSTRCALGAYVGYHPNDWLGLRFSLVHGGLAGNDAWIGVNKGGDGQTRRNRNLDFRSALNEATVLAEIYPTVWLEKNRESAIGNKGSKGYKVKPYVLLGVGLFHFNPQGVYTDPSGRSSWVDLRPLHTEGEGFPQYPDRKVYALTQLCIPMGAGATWFVDERWSISGEFLYVKTFTDYIDDVSTRYADPSLFYKYLSATLAPIADYMSNKSPLRDTPGSGYQPGNKRGDPGNKDGYMRFELKVGIRFGRVLNPGLYRQGT
jgi:hypothetical protein